jgi:hypothetical protein
LAPITLTTARSLSNLANVLYDQGDLDRARRLYERALSIREARLGADHPDTARSRKDLAAVVAALAGDVRQQLRREQLLAVVGQEGVHRPLGTR